VRPSVLERTLQTEVHARGKGDSQAMTDPTAAAPESKSPESVQISTYVQIWVDSFSQVIAQITGGPGSLPIPRGSAADL